MNVLNAPSSTPSNLSYQQQVFNIISSFSGHNANYVIPKEFMRLLRDSNSALILSQLVYWTGKGSDPDWVYKSYIDWENEIFLLKKSVMSAVKKLTSMGIVETQVRMIRLSNGMLGSRCVHYRVNQEKLSELILNQLESLQSAERALSKMPKGHFPKCQEGTFLPINTKTTAKNTNDLPKPSEPSPPDPVPEPKKPSSSFSFHDLNDLMQSVPQDKRSKRVEARLEKALQEHDVNYLKRAIAYTNQEPRKKYVSYLGQTIDNPEWHEGFDPDEHMRRLQADIDKLRAQQSKEYAEKIKAKEMSEKHKAVDELKIQEPDRYQELFRQACANIGIQNPDKPGMGKGLTIKFEIMRILGL